MEQWGVKVSLWLLHQGEQNGTKSPKFWFLEGYPGDWLCLIPLRTLHSKGVPADT